jgi:hypothetical protein
MRNLKNIFLSKIALVDALAEICKDIDFIGKRRKSSNITRGKIAGVIVYRIAKANIIHTNDITLLENRHFLKVNSLIALAIGFNYIKIDSKSIPILLLSEMMYSLTRRHVNQETLGLVFDAMIQSTNLKKSS